MIGNFLQKLFVLPNQDTIADFQLVGLVTFSVGFYRGKDIRTDLLKFFHCLFTKKEEETMWQRWKDNPLGLAHLYIKDTGAGGNCQFSSIAEAIRPIAKTPLTIADLREIAARQLQRLPEQQFQNMLSSYREEWKRHELKDGWNPFQVQTREQLAQAITHPNRNGNGFFFQGDHYTLELLSQALELNIFVLDYQKEYVLECGGNFARTICLLYHSQPPFYHYQLLGLGAPSSKDIYTVFSNGSRDLEPAAAAAVQ